MHTHIHFSWNRLFYHLFFSSLMEQHSKDNPNNRLFRTCFPCLCSPPSFSCRQQKPVCYECLRFLLLPLQMLALKTTIILSDLSLPQARDQSRLFTRRTLFDGHPLLVFCWNAAYCLFKFAVPFVFFKFWMQEFSVSQPSRASLFAMSLQGDSWAMAFPGVVIIEKCDGWLLV